MCLNSSKIYALTGTWSQLIFLLLSYQKVSFIYVLKQEHPRNTPKHLKKVETYELLLSLIVQTEETSILFAASFSLFVIYPQKIICSNFHLQLLICRISYWLGYILIMLRRVVAWCNFSKVKILRSTTNNIHFNLATEEYLFQTAHLAMPTLFLWQNSPTIVIGRHQNPWKECRNQLMKAQGVLLSRRKTGGGAVYHDLGNTCFSFLTPYNKGQEYDYKTVNNKILVAAFQRLGVEAEVAGRNDIHFNGKKISGSAYRLSLGGKDGNGRKALHHGTVLFNVDLLALQKFLNPNKKKLQSKGVSSVISRVMNLTEQYPQLGHQIFSRELQIAFQAHYGGPVEKQILQSQQLRRENPIIEANYERLRSWDWLYGQCPEFKYSIDKKFDWGMTEVTYNVQDGVINEGRIYSDCLYPDFIELANEELNRKVRYDKEGLLLLEERLKGRVGEEWQKMAEELCRWMQAQL